MAIQTLWRKLTGRDALRDAGSAPSGVLSLRWIVTGAAAALTIGAVVSVNGVAEHNARLAITREVETRLLLEARNVALTSAEALLTDFPELTLHPILRELKAKEKEIAIGLVVDRHGVIQGDSDARQLGSAYTPGITLRPVNTSAPLGPGEMLTGDSELLVAQAPVMHRNGVRMGVAIVGINRAYLDELFRNARRQQAAVVVFFLVVGIASSFLLMASILKPIAALRAGIERIGRGDLDTRVPVQDRTELGLLAVAMNDMAGELKRGQAEMVERERLAREVDLARQIQRSLLPSQHREVGDFLVAGTQRAAAEVGGDYYDFLALEGGRIGIAVADVAGKGLAGCLVMSMLSALLRAYRFSPLTPSALLAVLDERMSETLQAGSFITMFYGILDPLTGRLEFASAGHNPCLVYRAAEERVEWIKSSGIPLGAIRGGAIVKTLKDTTVELAPGDVLVQYTDGVSEAFDKTGEVQFGFDRMGATLLDSAKGGYRKVLDTFHRDLLGWSGDRLPQDDETILVVARTESQAAGAQSKTASSADQSAPPAASRPRTQPPAAQPMIHPETTGPMRPGLEPRMLDLGPAGPPPETRVTTPANAEAGSGPAAVTPNADRLAAPGIGLEPLGCLAEARLRGRCLRLEPSIDALVGIRPWVEECFALHPLGKTPLVVLSAALYEAAANVVEHGEVGDQGLELHWVPMSQEAPGAPSEGISYFLLRDHGQPFSADNWKQTDFTDPAARKRKRGFGLDIIHRAMSVVSYHPSTSLGNITLMVFELDRGNEERELRSA